MNVLFVIIVLVIALIFALGLYFVFSSHPAKQPTQTTTTTTSKIITTSRTTTTSKIITTSRTTTLVPDTKWTSVVGYTDSFNKCRDLCKQYQSKCDSQLAIQYCRADVLVDLDRDGNIDSDEMVLTPSGTQNCETNTKCYDIISGCVCGDSSLTIGS